MKLLLGLKIGNAGHGRRPKKLLLGKNFLGGGLQKKKTSTGVKNSCSADPAGHPRKLLLGLKTVEQREWTWTEIEKTCTELSNNKKNFGRRTWTSKKKLLLGLKKFEWRTLVEDTNKLLPG